MERGRSREVRLGAMIVAVIAGTLLVAGSAAHAADLSIPIRTSYSSGVAAGQQVELASVGSRELAGWSCAVSVVRRDSATKVNAGNDLIVSSGGGSVTLTDVERAAGAETAGETLVLGEEIAVVLAMGPEEEFAADLDVRFDCVASAGPQAAASASDQATAGPTASPQADALPATGAATAALAWLAIGLIALGSAALLATRLPAEAGSAPTGRPWLRGDTAGSARRGRP